MPLPAHSQVPLWYFALLTSSGSALTLSLGFVLKSRGQTESEIASVASLIAIPTVLFFLWSPLIDIYFNRRIWIVLLSFVSALSVGAAFSQLPPPGSPWFIFLILLYMACTSSIGGAAGALAAINVRPDQRGIAGAFLGFGNVGIGSAGASLVVLIFGKMSATAAGWILPAFAIVPALMTLVIPEPARPQESGNAVWKKLAANLRRGLRHRPVREGLLIVFSPVGSGALIFLFPTITKDYGVTAGVAAFSILASGLLAVAGAFLGGRVVQRIGPRRAFAVTGLVTALTALSMMVAPLNPSSYAIGSILYFAASGGAFAAFSALALELTGVYTEWGAAWFGVFMSLTNSSAIYMFLLDSAIYEIAGPRAMLAVDGGIAGLSSITLLIWSLSRKDSAEDRQRLLGTLEN